MKTKLFPAETTFSKRMAEHLATACVTRRLPLLVLCALAFTTQAQDYRYVVDRGTITITGYTCAGGGPTSVTIPSAINGVPVTSIGAYAFNDCTNLASVTIPEGVTAVGPVAFFGCISLTNVIIPASVTIIWADAFWNTGLDAITVEALNSFYSSVDGVLFDKSQTRLIQYPYGKAGSYTIPNGVTSIRRAAFTYCNRLTSVTISDSVIDIGDYAFSFSEGLTSVTIGNGVTSIQAGAFYGCTSLTSVTLGNSVTSVGDNAFSSTRLISLTIPNSVTTIGVSAFAGCGGLSSITLGNSVTSVGDEAFRGCASLTSVTLGNSVSSIGARAFSMCTKLSAITVEPLNSFYSSVAGVLFNKNQTTLIHCPNGKGGSYAIPDSVTNTGDYAFEGCTSLTGVIVPNSVARIGTGAFSGCTALGNITLPSSVTRVGDGAFVDCTSLAAITVEARNFSYSSVDGVLFNKSQTTLIQYPRGKAGAYPIPNSVTTIWGLVGVGGAFSGCSSLSSVTIPNSVTSLGAEAFSGCTGLASVAIPNSVTGSIGAGAFSGCTNLSSVTIGNNVTRIEARAFSWCTSLTSVTIPDSVTSIGGNEYGGGAFSGCEKLSSVRIGNAVTDIGPVAFSGCSSLTAIAIPNSVTTIGYRAFSYCTSLSSITIGNGLPSIGAFAFDGCTNLTRIYFAGDASGLTSDDLFKYDDVFTYLDKAIVYYLPGTHWDSTFGGRPTALWKPMAQASGASFGVRANQFGFSSTWASDRVVVVEASASLTNPTWSAVATNTLAGGLSYFSDPQWTNYPARFYRLRSP